VVGGEIGLLGLPELLVQIGLLALELLRGLLRLPRTGGLSSRARLWRLLCLVLLALQSWMGSSPLGKLGWVDRRLDDSRAELRSRRL
jgi:hypothetical protein